MSVYGTDWRGIAGRLEKDLERPANWDDLSPEDQETHPYGRHMKAVLEGYAKARADEVTRGMLQPREPLKVVGDAEILNRPSPEWIVEGLIQENTICLFAGPGGIGKSFWSLGLARSVASGFKFFGREVKQGRVLYVVAEGASAFGDRVRAWSQTYCGMVPKGHIRYVEAGVNLQDPESVAELGELVRQGDFSLVILDTLSQLAHLENENSNSEIARVFLAIKRLRDVREGTSILVVDHTPAGSSKPRGATAKRDNSDTTIVCLPDSQGGFSVSTVMDDWGKQKDGVPERWHGFSLQPVGNSAVIVNNGGKRPASPYWEKVSALLADGKPHKPSELRAVCGITGNAATKDGKALTAELNFWIGEGLVTVQGNTSTRTYQLAPKVAGVAA